jgi:intracellular multiplication protein IcmE
MSAQMQTILGKKVPQTSSLQNVTNAKSYLQQRRQERQQMAQQEAEFQQQQAQGGQANQAQAAPPPLIPAGEVIYAQMITQADSDVPGPILARILTGPLKGGRAIGSFARQEKVLVLNFSRVVKDGREYPISAVAIDPETTLTGVATDVNNRYFSRIAIPAATEFISSLGEAISNTGSTEVRVEGDTVVTEEDDLDTQEELAEAGGQAADRVAEFIEEEAPEEIQVRVDAGTPFGLLLLSAVQAQP